MIGATTIEWLAKTCIWTTLIIRCVKMNSSCDGSRVVPINILICMEMICDQWSDKYNFFKTNIIFSSSVWCGEWIVHSSLSSQIVDSGLSMQVSFLFLFLGEGSKQRVPNNTSFLFHVVWQMLSSFHLYRWAKGKTFILQNRTFYFGEPPQFFFFFNFLVMGKLAHCKKKKKLGGILSNEQERLIGWCEIYLKPNKLVCPMIQSCCLLTMFAYNQGL